MRPGAPHSALRCARTQLGVLLLQALRHPQEGLSRALGALQGVAGLHDLLVQSLILLLHQCPPLVRQARVLPQQLLHSVCSPGGRRHRSQESGQLLVAGGEEVPLRQARHSLLHGGDGAGPTPPPPPLPGARQGPLRPPQDLLPPVPTRR